MVGLAMMLAISLAGGPDQRQPTGDDLVADCLKPKPRFCLSYIREESNLDTAVVVLNNDTAFCRSDMTDEELRDSVLAFLEKHSDQRPRGAKGLIEEAMKENFPCPKPDSQDSSGAFKNR